MRAIIFICMLFAINHPSLAKNVVPPVTGQANNGGKKDDQSQAKQEITINLPANTNLVLSGSLNVKSESVEKRADEESNKWSDPLTLLTLVLAFANIALWWTTRRIANEAKTASGTAKIAADAAKKSADALIDSEKATIGIEEIQMREGWGWTGATLSGAFPRQPGVTFNIKNYGSTPGWFRSAEINFRLLGELPHNPIYRDRQEWHGMIAPNQPVPVRRWYSPELEPDKRLEISDDIQAQINEEKLRFFVFCRIRYRDVFHAERVFRGAWEYIVGDFRGPRWRPCGPDSYWEST